jgi:hypothetical protein
MTVDLVIALSIRLGLALLFVAAAWHKLSDRRRFETAVRAYELLPKRASSLLSWLLPAVEAAIAIGLLYPAWQRSAAIAAAGVLLLYTGAMAVNLARGRRRIDCGCFRSRSATPLSAGLVARNLGLIAAACVLLLPVGTRALTWIDGFTSVATLVTLSLLWMAAQRLSHTGPALRGLGGAR